MTSLYLLLGSNLGDRCFYLAEATTRLEALFGKTRQKSSFYETAAWGLEDQPPFLNQVLVFNTGFSPRVVLALTQRIEQDLGRIRKERWGARVIDIDVLFYGQQVITTPELHLPHPQLHLRRFTLTPLAQVAPTFMHPVLQKTISQLLEECPDPLEVKEVG
ncbi:2-amino-4-hydroxy-6-hydroxymethyldihydropteridine diphosphokinase [Rufibacter glacialis]|uniref:2-amino-4-hydroxy-6-hydroxymethyldihydropteridine pyrophosphokinase n=1 Tax=Rufibacter glacialis TaxID=1259555 RepID=A0A5M8Q900_9BACT|nr:2-amino-4-hydroxy-6-hydroxymethyldihydropteridine diphosphokinase [Rufibacter glacialis]KAA6432349.1 2-amino-4-hydroxy-6-hydroxymethyldihydropteridine diphosphokinase [Rufibacter glacialis]GGK77966.1 2-amino-4-hydroxy-6-hydroxymethyldihydropteridine diphosphokinase [Rufibacter glacialis]